MYAGCNGRTFFVVREYKYSTTQISYIVMQIVVVIHEEHNKVKTSLHNLALCTISVNNTVLSL
jgi:hypothetical protein